MHRDRRGNLSCSMAAQLVTASNTWILTHMVKRENMLQQSCDEIAAQCALFATRRLARSLSRVFDASLAPLGLRGTQFNVLVAIARRRGTTLTALGAALGMDRTTLTHALRPLRREGLVTPLATLDRRAHAVKLTPLGRRRVEASVTLWREAQARVEQAAGEADWPTLNRQLRRLNRSLNDQGTGGA